jgi:hypothetical protein
MVEIVEEGDTVRLVTPEDGMQRLLARVVPPVALLMIFAGIVGATGGSADGIASIVFGVLLLGTLWLGLGTTVTIEPATRTVYVHERYAYKPARKLEVPFADIREIELFRDMWRSPPQRGQSWITMWLHRHEGRWLCVAGPVDADAAGIALIERASELAHARIGAPITGSAREPRAL